MTTEETGKREPLAFRGRKRKKKGAFGQLLRGERPLAFMGVETSSNVSGGASGQPKGENSRRVGDFCQIS